MRAIAALAVALGLAAPVWADETGCEAQLATIVRLVGKVAGYQANWEGIPEEITPGVCVVEAPVWRGRSYFTLKAERISWSGENLDRMATEGLPPTAVALDIAGFRVVPEIGDPVMTYLMEMQGRGEAVDISLRAGWDAAERVLRIERAEIDFPGGDYIRFSADAEGVDLTDMAAIQMSAGSFGITRTLWEIRSFGLFENLLLLPVGMNLLVGADDPAAKVAEMKETARREIAAIPDAIVPARSRAALIALVDDMPNPAGTLRIEMNAEPGLGVARAMPLAMSGSGLTSLDDIWAVMDGVRYDITYDRQR